MFPPTKRESPPYRLDTRSVNQLRRGHPTRHWDFKPELWFFAISIAEHFEFDSAWYRGTQVRRLVLTYYLILRSILEARPSVRRCLKRCRHCRIYFLTDRRNAGRKDEREVGRQDLRCPFGCSKAHAKQQSTQRSVAYYQTEEGKRKKQRLNQRRRRSAGKAPAPENESLPPPAGAPWPEPVVEHVRVVVSLIEGRRVSRDEILQMLTEVLRQPSLARQRKIDHAVSWLHENPP